MGKRASGRASRWAMVVMLVVGLATGRSLDAAGKEITIIQPADVRGLDPSSLLGTVRVNYRLLGRDLLEIDEALPEVAI